MAQNVAIVQFFVSRNLNCNPEGDGLPNEDDLATEQIGNCRMLSLVDLHRFIGILTLGNLADTEDAVRDTLVSACKHRLLLPVSSRLSIKTLSRCRLKPYSDCSGFDCRT